MDAIKPSGPKFERRCSIVGAFALPEGYAPSSQSQNLLCNDKATLRGAKSVDCALRARGQINSGAAALEFREASYEPLQSSPIAFGDRNPPLRQIPLSSPSIDRPTGIFIALFAPFITMIFAGSLHGLNPAVPNVRKQTPATRIRNVPPSVHGPLRGTRAKVFLKATWQGRRWLCWRQAPEAHSPHDT